MGTSGPSPNYQPEELECYWSFTYLLRKRITLTTTTGTTI